MPGKTIGKKLEAPSQVIWRGFIEVKLTNRKHTFKIDSLASDPLYDAAIKECLGSGLRDLDTLNWTLG
jgi:hypothetical protein